MRNRPPASSMLLLTVLLATGAGETAFAACTEAHMLVSAGNVMNDDSCLQYCTAPAPNLSTKADALFWALGHGDPAIGAGADSGAFRGRAIFHGRPPLNYGNGTFYNYERGFDSNWGASFLIDGCSVQAGPDGCTCLLLADENGGQGYFAMLSAKANSTLDFWFTKEPRLSRIPTPEVLGRGGRDGRLTLQVRVPRPARGTVPGPNGGCSCGPEGYRLTVHGGPADAGGAAVSRQRRNWKPVGTSVHPFGEPVEVEIPCPSGDEVVYLSALLTFADGFESPVVGAQTGPLSCR